jgi:Na+-driven multidrug efflux pump
MQPRHWLSRPQTLWAVASIGIPTGIQSGVSTLYMLIVMLLLRPFGPVEQAAFGIGQRLYLLGVTPLVALSGATSVVAGQNFGARRGDRILGTFTTSLVLAVALVPVLWLIAQLFPRALVSVFSRDPAIVSASVHFLKIVSYSLLPVSVLHTCFGLLSGFANTRARLITAIAYVIVVTVPAWALSQHPSFRPDWLWKLTVGGTVLEMAGGLFFLRAEFRRQSCYLMSAPAAGS